jgi:hypothetical protein
LAISVAATFPLTEYSLPAFYKNTSGFGGNSEQFFCHTQFSGFLLTLHNQQLTQGIPPRWGCAFKDSPVSPENWYASRPPIPQNFLKNAYSPLWENDRK